MTTRCASPLRCLCLVIAVSAGCSRQPAPPATDESEVLDGVWVPVSLHEKGKQVDAATVKKVTISIAKGKYRRFDGSTGDVTLGLQVDATKTPAEIDLVHLEGKQAGLTQLGIFTLQGERLTLLIADIDEPRPTRFAPRDKAVLLSLVRKKAD